MTNNQKPNRLIHSSSPYLKQHAYNPVDWRPWGQEALAAAQNQNKPIIVSIGYSACHWCHVMERECFEKEEIAKLMNEHFICIKVDREERPDVDQVYMDAIQTMGINGGWPLNVFTLPDQSPFYGGTYFPPRQWIHLLGSIAGAFKENYQQLRESADGFREALRITDTEKYRLGPQEDFPDKNGLKSIVQSLSRLFDPTYGGLNRAPKFPNPPIWQFLLHANTILNDESTETQLIATLDQMAAGGIYDQVGGGFARYSVDDKWFAPHFEKMLYDNAQLISLYARAWQVYKKSRYKEVVYESIAFVKRELTSPNGGFYSALDADSDGEEGNFYIWSEHELDTALGDESALIKNYYNTTPGGNWERGKNILFTRPNDTEFVQNHSLEEEQFSALLQKSKETLLAAREQRNRPGLDDKIITSWNALMLRGLIDAYRAFGDEAFLDLALQNASFIQRNLFSNGALIRSYNPNGVAIPAFLDDYAFTIDAWLHLYQVTLDEKWLDLAHALLKYAIAHFYDPEEGLFFYTDDSAEKLIARKKEVFDNVIPASNSAMAINLYFFGILFDKDEYLKMSDDMLAKFSGLIQAEPQYLCHWGTLFAYRTSPLAEIAIVGPDAQSTIIKFENRYIPNKIIMGGNTDSSLPLLRGKEALSGKNTIYVCYDKSCKLPVHSTEEALRQIL
ncbi:MAG: thioredoxin domain-containing protein [Cyclobacteriaceae bacterium]|nr:thioredoxin domain-containing protein [Cyclobacteriaceae bacterium]